MRRERKETNLQLSMNYFSKKKETIFATIDKIFFKVTEKGKTLQLSTNNFSN